MQYCFLCAGCATLKVAPPTGVGLDLSAARSDYSVLATVEGTGKAYTIVGIPLPFGAPVGSVFSGLSVPGLQVPNKAMGIATYDALGKVPDADTIMPLTTTLEKNGIPFIFRTYSATVKGKAIKIKTDAELGK